MRWLPTLSLPTHESEFNSNEIDNVGFNDHSTGINKWDSSVEVNIMGLILTTFVQNAPIRKQK